MKYISKIIHRNRRSKPHQTYNFLSSLICCFLIYDIFYDIFCDIIYDIICSIAYNINIINHFICNIIYDIINDIRIPYLT